MKEEIKFHYIDPKNPLNDPIVDEKTGQVYWPRKWITKEEALKMFPKGE